MDMVSKSAGFWSGLFPAYRESLSSSVKKSLNQSFRDTDVFMLRLLLIHWVVASTLTAFTNSTYILGIVGGGVLMGIAYAVYSMNPGSLLSRITMGASFMGFSMIFIQQHLGRIEMHFHIFIAIAFLIRYKDIAPVLAATVTTAVHHALFNIAQSMELSLAGTPIMIFDYGCGWNLVALHALFVIIEMAVICNIILNLTREYLNNAEVFTILDDISESAYHTGQAADVISTSGQELAMGSAQNAEAVTESNKSIDQMNRKILELNDKTASVKDRISTISQNTERMNQSMTDLKESSSRITAITQTIDSIASQTNLLALNAAVEAARAGEAGAGFAVVTEEVRVLAQKTAAAATNISEMIEDNIQKAVHGSEVSERISAQIAELMQWIDEVHGSSDEQVAFLDGLKRAIANISQTTEKTAGMAEENASTAEELQSQVHLLQSAIEDINSRVSLNKAFEEGDRPGSGAVPYSNNGSTPSNQVNGSADGGKRQLSENGFSYSANGNGYHSS